MAFTHTIESVVYAVPPQPHITLHHIVSLFRFQGPHNLLYHLNFSYQTKFKTDFGAPEGT